VNFAGITASALPPDLIAVEVEGTVVHVEELFSLYSKIPSSSLSTPVPDGSLTTASIVVPPVESRSPTHGYGLDVQSLPAPAVEISSPDGVSGFWV